MELATIRLYLQALERIKARYPSQARGLIEELSHSLNEISETLEPIERGPLLTPFEWALRDEVRHLQLTKGKS